jgi:hypothetical protein
MRTFDGARAWRRLNRKYKQEIGSLALEIAMSLVSPPDDSPMYRANEIVHGVLMQELLEAASEGLPDEFAEPAVPQKGMELVGREDKERLQDIFFSGHLPPPPPAAQLLEPPSGIDVLLAGIAGRSWTPVSSAVLTAMLSPLRRLRCIKREVKRTEMAPLPLTVLNSNMTRLRLVKAQDRNNNMQ